MKTTMIAFVIGLLLAGISASAQTPAPRTPQGRQGVAPPPPPPPPPPAPAAPPVARSNTNIRVDVTIIDEGGSRPLRKTVTVTSVDGLRASSRTTAGFGNGEINLSVDATPALRMGKIQTRVVAFYRPTPAVVTGGDANQRPEASLNLDFSIALDDGKRVVASQTTDPGSDRRVTVEVVATILK
jgi:hypothetical protein